MNQTSQSEKKEDLVIPVVFLGNAYQTQHLIVEVPENKHQNDSKVEELTPEEMKLLKKFNFQEIKPIQEATDVEIPCFLTQEQVELTLRILEIDDVEERRLKLYAIFQTSPQMFHQINQYLPPEYQLSLDIDFQNLHEVKIPIYDTTNKKIGELDKILQLSPYFLKEHPPQIKQFTTDCLNFNSLFNNKEAYKDIITKQLKCQTKNFNCSTASPLQHYKLLNDAVPKIVPKSSQVQLFHFITDDDLNCYIKQKQQQSQTSPQNFQQVQEKSVFAERFKEQTKRKFLTLINTKYKQLHAKELIDLLSNDAQKKQQIDYLEIAVGFLYFDKLDIIYIFQLMQQVNQSLLTQLRNNQFGWPSSFPVRNGDLTIRQIAEKTEQKYHELKTKNQNLIDIYNKIFCMQKKQFESNNYTVRIVNVVKNLTINGQQLVELSVTDGTFIGTVHVSKQLYDAGSASFGSQNYKALIDNITSLINQTKQKTRKPRQVPQQNNKENNQQDEEETQQSIITGKPWKKTNQKKLIIKPQKQLSEDDTTMKFIYAGKLNTLTIFDLDNFFDLCISLCKNDLQYPPFYYEDLQTRTSFGQQLSMIKAPQQTYLVLLRFFFGDYEYLKKNKTLTSYMFFYKLAQAAPLECLEDSFTPHDLVESEGEEEGKTSGQTENIKEKKENTTTTTNLSTKAEDPEFRQNGYFLPRMVMGCDEFVNIMEGKVDFATLQREMVDKCDIFRINAKDVSMLGCNKKCHHCNCHFQNTQCNDSCNQQFDQSQLIKIENIALCPDIFDYQLKRFKPGYILLSQNDLFRDDTDDPLTYNFISKMKEFSFKSQVEINEYFYQFYNYAFYPNYKKMNYAAMTLSLLEMYYNCSPTLQNQTTQNIYDELFSDYFSCRIDALFMQNDRTNYWNKYQTITQLLQKCNKAPQNITIQHLQRLKEPYDRQNVAADLFNNAMQYFDFKIQPSNYFTQKMLSSYWQARGISNTTTSVINHTLRGPDVIHDMMKEEICEKWQFQYPIPDNQEIEPEVDISVLKKDSILTQLKTFGQSYKQMPDEMFNKLKYQHQELFDIGTYEMQKFKTPTTFQETKQMANSVLNHGKYFTIPFGSEANRHVEQNLDLDYDDNNELNELTSLMERHKSASSSVVKSQYVKWAGPTGAEAQVCHIEEEQLCFGLFKLRANQLMKILIEWIAIYMPALLKFFDCTLNTTSMDSCPEINSAFIYRVDSDQILQNKYGQKQNQYFYQNDYKYIYEQNAENQQSEDEEEDDDAPPVFKAFSAEFDKTIIDILQIFNNYQKISVSDEILTKAKVEQLCDPWLKGCYAPIQTWPFTGSGGVALPPPPHIPAILQFFLTQLYTTGDILDELFKNPIVTIPVIARTVQHQVALLKHGEQRAAAVWRNLYPDAYYRSIDHANICLQLYDKKIMQQKPLQSDLQRRIQDYEMGYNPQFIDSAIDFCLPKVFDIVNFQKYAKRMELKLNIDAYQPKYLSSYQERLYLMQNFQPASNILMPFKLPAHQVTSLIAKLCDQQNIAQELRDSAAVLWRRITVLAFNTENQQFQPEHFKSVLDQQEHDEIYDKLYNIYQNTNFSVLLPSQLLKDYIGQVQQKQQNRQSFQAIEQPQEKEALFMEDLVYELCYNEQLENNELNTKYYSDQNIQNQLVDHIKLLKFDNSDAPKKLKQQLEEVFVNNKYLQSLFVDQNSQQMRQLSTVYTKLRQCSMPTATLRSLYFLRCCIFNDKLPESMILRLARNEIDLEEMQQYSLQQQDQQKMKIIKYITSPGTASQQKTTAQQLLPNLQNDLSRKQIFDMFLIPLLLDSDADHSKIRYIDNEIYVLMRFLLIACYRLEYCFKVIEELPRDLRQCAVYGTRSIHPTPYSQYNQQCLGMSLFGNNLVELFEQQQKMLTKSQQESLPLLVSLRVLNSHQPSQMQNNTDISVNECRCQCVSCPFCGGIGAGYNGTLSGNVNLRAASSAIAEMDVDLINGYSFDTVDNKTAFDFTWDDLVFMKTCNYKQRISLLYKLQPTVIHYENETSVYVQSDEKINLQSRQQSRRERNSIRSRDTETDSEVSDHFDINAKLKQLYEPKDDLFIQNFGYRMSDTTLMLPPPDFLTQQYMFEHNRENPFTRDYMDKMSHYQSIVSQDGLPVGPFDQKDVFNDTNCENQILYDDPIYSFLLNRDAANQYYSDIRQFLNRNFIVPKADMSLPFKDSNPLEFAKDIKVLFDLMLKINPTQTSNSKEDYIQDKVYSILGTHGYPFLSLKKLANNLYKKVDSMAGKLLGQHYDLINLQYFKSSKATLSNNLTSSLLMFGIWQNLQPNLQEAVPALFGQNLTMQLRDLGEPLYLAENLQGFVTLQNIAFETEKKK